MDLTNIQTLNCRHHWNIKNKFSRKQIKRIDKIPWNIIFGWEHDMYFYEIIYYTSIYSKTIKEQLSGMKDKEKIFK